MREVRDKRNLEFIIHELGHQIYIFNFFFSFEFLFMSRYKTDIFRNYTQSNLQKKLHICLYLHIFRCDREILNFYHDLHQQYNFKIHTT